MRILLSCLQDLRLHPIPAYRFWSGYFRNGIDEAGHEWVEVPGVDWAEGITNLPSDEQAKWRARTWDRVLDFLAQEKQAGRPVDLFLTYLYPAQIDPAAISHIRGAGVPCVNFFCDNVREFVRLPVEYGHFDLHWVPEFEALPLYRKAGFKHVHAPMPVWIAPENRTAAVNEQEETVFIGSEDVLRRKFLAEAIRLGAPLKIGGRGWTVDNQTVQQINRPRSLAGTLRNQADFIRKRGVTGWLRKTARTVRPELVMEIAAEHYLPSISGQEYVRITKESQIVIGINRVPTFSHPLSNPLKYSRLRDIEAPMMGACYLTEWTEGLSQFYELGTEIETYGEVDELVDKITELRADPVRRKRLRERGQRRALSELSVPRSLDKIRLSLGLA